MPEIVGIRFKSGHKIYDFEVNGFNLKIGDAVVVESEFGLSIGVVVRGPQFSENPEKELKKIIRIATDEDIQAYQNNKEIEKEGKVYCLERIMARGLQMKLVDVEATLDRKRIIFYFTAEGRIDFRELVKDLAARYKTRIEMRQIGVRDEAKLAGGIGICGRELCCKTFLTSFEPVSIKMIKKKDIALNVNRLSGLCNRLMCCLRFEYDEKEEIADEATIEINDDILKASIGNDYFLNLDSDQIYDGTFYNIIKAEEKNGDQKDNKEQLNRANLEKFKKSIESNKSNFRFRIRRENKNDYKQ
ncbi:MAG: hypothetical protein N2511_07770 [Thermodesulfovibrionales bacterium]|nr:hypothetical protein [Thermodesulfovibrionales bacterium]